MSATIALTGELEASSARGSIRLVGNDERLEMHVSAPEALLALIPGRWFGYLRKHSSALGHLAQPFDLYVAGKLWLSLKQGRWQVRSPARLAFFALRLFFRPS